MERRAISPPRRVEHHVQVADHSREVARLVVDQLVGAQAADEFVLGGARRANHVGAASLGDLHGQVPDAASCPVDQHPLPGRELGGVDQALPGGEARQRQRGGLGMRQPGRLAGELAGRRRYVLRVGAGRAGEKGHPVYFVADVKPGDAFQALNHARDVPAEDERRLADQRELAGPDKRLHGVHAHGLDADQHLCGQRHWPVYLSNLQDLGTAESLLNNGMHALEHLTSG